MTNTQTKIWNKFIEDYCDVANVTNDLLLKGRGFSITEYARLSSWVYTDARCGQLERHEFRENLPIVVDGKLGTIYKAHIGGPYTFNDAICKSDIPPFRPLRVGDIEIAFSIHERDPLEQAYKQVEMAAELRNRGYISCSPTKEDIERLVKSGFPFH